MGGVTSRLPGSPGASVRTRTESTSAAGQSPTRGTGESDRATAAAGLPPFTVRPDDRLVDAPDRHAGARPRGRALAPGRAGRAAPPSPGADARGDPPRGVRARPGRAAGRAARPPDPDPRPRRAPDGDDPPAPAQPGSALAVPRVRAAAH